MATVTQSAVERNDERGDSLVRLPPRIGRMLGRMRRRIRAYVWLEGIAVSIAWLGLAFWACLLLDYLVEPVWPVRVVAIGAVAAVLAAIIFRLILRRTFVPLTDANMAVLLERNFAAFNDRLLTTVELAGHPSHARRFSTEMLSHTTDQALGVSRQVSLAEAFKIRPLLWRMAAAALLSGTIGAFSLLAPNAFAFYLERIGGSPEPWPRQTLMQVDGFSTQFALVAGSPDSGSSEAARLHVFHGTVEVDRKTPQRITQAVSAGHSVAIASGDDGTLASLAPQTVEQVIPGVARLGRISAADETEGLVALRRVGGGKVRSDDTEITSGRWLPKTKCRLARGTAELMFNNGVLVVVEGPAEFQIRSSTRMSLHSGRIVVTAPTRASNFVVDSPMATVRALRNDTLKVVLGSDVEIVARAYALKTIPDLVELRYKTSGGGNGREIMQQQSTAIPGRDEFQNYSYTFKNVLSSIRFSVRGGDDRIGDLKIEVVDSPRFLESKVYCRFPDYLVDQASGRFTPREQPAGGTVELPQGTHVTVRVKANTPVSRIHVRQSDQQNPDVIDLPSGRKDPSRFEYDFGRLGSHATLLFTLFDEDGISNRQPIPLKLTAIPDEPPSVEVKLRGVGTAITADARLAIGGQISDDHGLSRAWFSLSLGQQDPAKHALRGSLGGQRLASFGKQPADALDLKQLRLLSNLTISPGNRIRLSVKASDLCTLGQSPGVGEGDTYFLDVVTPEDLLGMLESRELILRQKFETTMAELEQTRDTLADPVFSPAVSSEKSSDEKSSDEKADAEKADAEKRPAPPAHRNASALAQRASQNSQRSAYETSRMAAAFLEIRDELVTNRIDTAQRKQRLEQDIARPLRRIADEMFPVLQQRLDALGERVVLENRVSSERAQLADTTGDNKTKTTALAAKIEQAEAKLAIMQPAATLAQGAREQADAILTEMKAVLDKMLELEDYNRIVEILRELIKQQEDLNKKTKKKQLEDLGLGF